MEVNIEAISIGERTITSDHLLLILRHYDAIHILVQSAQKNKDHKALSDWDEARR